MKLTSGPWAALLLGSLALLALAQGLRAEVEPSNGSDELEQQTRTELDSSLRASHKLPKLFDFSLYKQLFEKTYQSAVEEMVRMKLFMARSFRAFISGVSYKHYRLSYYLALNPRSDWTPEELRASEMSADLVNNLPKGVNVVEISDEDSEEDFADVEEVEAELERIEAHRGEPGYAQLAAELDRLTEAKRQQQQQHQRRRRRRKRSPRAGRPGQVRADFELESALIKSQPAPEVAPEVLAKVLNATPASNNPDYEAPEFVSFGARPDGMLDTQIFPASHFKRTYLKRVSMGRVWQRKSSMSGRSSPARGQQQEQPGRPMVWLTSAVVGGLNSLFKPGNVGPREVLEEDHMEEEEDILWVDHRRSNCLFGVHEQGRCGSCYAFAVVAALEWSYCRETGSLVRFSEQYLIDCGARYSDNLNGCAGARIDIAGEFIQNYGLELAQHYPYLARDDECPYEPSTEPAKMGYIRLSLDYIANIPYDMLEDYLQYAPMVVNIVTKGDFYEYGGGVHEGKECDKMGTHSVLLIGHGREEGREYWLMKNSHSTRFGENGYYKLAKDTRCIQPPSGYMYGTHNGKKIRLFPERNSHVERPVKKRAGGSDQNSQRRVPQNEKHREEIEQAERREKLRQLKAEGPGRSGPPESRRQPEESSPSVNSKRLAERDDKRSRLRELEERERRLKEELKRRNYLPAGLEFSP